MAVYLVSDVHLRLDRPDRAQRLAGLVDELNGDDRLMIVGDLCDFWFASRQSKLEPLNCPGLKSLARFRDRGGSITLLLGNHDTWLGPFYQHAFGAILAADPHEFQAFGQRVIVAHGHLLGARRWWKATMESEEFLKAFELLPDVLARGFERALDFANERGREASNLRHLIRYRAFADSLADRADLVAFGHIHQPFDDDAKRPRLIVLGGWHQTTSCLRIDAQGAKQLFRPPPVETIEPATESRRHDGERVGKSEE
ncbi:MAG: UDP-2,3-diacylglucosamine diphosphatase [Isosphaeraceae bacterium]